MLEIRLSLKQPLFVVISQVATFLCHLYCYISSLFGKHVQKTVMNLSAHSAIGHQGGIQLKVCEAPL
jgi:hypothetical protein